MTGVSARIVLSVTAVVACAWFALGIRALQDEASVRDYLHQHGMLTHTQAKAEDAVLAEAHFLNPDHSLDTLRALVESQSGDLRGAAVIAQKTARQEPASISNWLILQFLAGGTNPAVLRLTQRRIRALAPPVPAR